MNTLKIVRIASEKRFNDTVKVALFDENQNIIKEECFEDVTAFEMSDSIDVAANNIRMENEKLKQDIRDLRQRNGLYFEMIEVLIKRIRELNEELESYE